MTAAVSEDVDGRTFLPSNEPAEVIDFIAHLQARGREAAPARARLVDVDGKSVELPESMLEVLVQAAESMKAGLAVTVAPHHLTLSTQEAADLLRISRTTLVRLLESGVIPFDKPSRHRKVRLADLLEYRRRQRRVADQALVDMVADTQRLGLYEEDSQAVGHAVKAARAAAAQTPSV